MVLYIIQTKCQNSKKQAMVMPRNRTTPIRSTTAPTAKNSMTRNLWARRAARSEMRTKTRWCLGTVATRMLTSQSATTKLMRDLTAATSITSTLWRVGAEWPETESGRRSSPLSTARRPSLQSKTWHHRKWCEPNRMCAYRKRKWRRIKLTPRKLWPKAAQWVSQK